MPIINLVYESVKEWSPWSNTLAYYPLTTATTNTDQSWNNRNLTVSWITAWTYAGVDCSLVKWLGTCSITSTTFTAITLNCWFNMNTKSDHYCLVMWLKSWTATNNTNNTFILGDFDGRPTNWFWLQYSPSSWWNQSWLWSWTPWTRWVWYNGCITWDGSTIKVYLNWELKTSTSWSTQLARDAIILWWSSNNSNVYVSNAIYESKARSEAEITKYYESTKWNYGY